MPRVRTSTHTQVGMSSAPLPPNKHPPAMPCSCGLHSKAVHCIESVECSDFLIPGNEDGGMFKCSVSEIDVSRGAPCAVPALCEMLAAFHHR